MYIPVHTYIFNLCWQSWGWNGSSGIVLYIGGSFVKHKIPVRPIRNLNLVGSGKASPKRILGMMPSVCKSATLAQSDPWRKEHRLRLHHACIVHVVDMVNRFCGEDKHVLCADGQVYTCHIRWRTVCMLVPSCSSRATCVQRVGDP